MLNEKLSFLSNNVKGIKAAEKRLKVFWKFQKLKHSCGVCVSPRNTLVGICWEKKTWSDKFYRQLLLILSISVVLHAKLYYVKRSVELLNKFNDKSGRVLIIELKIENKVLLLINLYKASTENKQYSTLSDLRNVIEKNTIDINKKSPVFGGDFNLFFEGKLKTQGANPVPKKKSLAKLTQIKEDLICLIFGELENQAKSVVLFVNNTFLIIFKEDFIIFSYLMFYKNL